MSNDWKAIKETLFLTNIPGMIDSIRLGREAKGLVDMIKKNPYQNAPAYEKLVGNK